MKTRIDSDIKSAMISKDTIKRDVLRFIKSEIQRSEAGVKILDDSDIQKLMRTQIENLKTITNSDTTLTEISILESYLPKLLTHDEVRTIIESHISDMPNLGLVMKYFATNYKGLVDNKIVSQITNEILNK